MSQFKEKFQAITKMPVAEQGAFFAKRFVFRLTPEQYAEVEDLQVKFLAALAHDDGKADSLSPAVAADFFQKNGQTRTAMQRKAELADVDVNGDGRTSFIEYLMLHFKLVILQEFFDRKQDAPDVDMTNHGVGLTGVGDRLIEELFAPPQGVDPELEKMMRDFANGRAEHAKQIADLEAVVAEGGVKGMAAKTKLEGLLKEDTATINHMEAKIAAAIKKAEKNQIAKVAEYEALKEKAKAEKDSSMKAGLSGKVGAFNH